MNQLPTEIILIIFEISIDSSRRKYQTAVRLRRVSRKFQAIINTFFLQRRLYRAIFDCDRESGRDPVFIGTNLEDSIKTLQIDYKDKLLPAYSPKFNEFHMYDVDDEIINGTILLVDQDRDRLWCLTDPNMNRTEMMKLYNKVPDGPESYGFQPLSLDFDYFKAYLKILCTHRGNNGNFYLTIETSIKGQWVSIFKGFNTCLVKMKDK